MGKSWTEGLVRCGLTLGVWRRREGKARMGTEMLVGSDLSVVGWGEEGEGEG